MESQTGEATVELAVIEVVLAYGSTAKIKVGSNWEDVYLAFTNAVSSKKLFNEEGFTDIAIIIDEVRVDILDASKVLGYSII